MSESIGTIYTQLQHDCFRYWLRKARCDRLNRARHQFLRSVDCVTRVSFHSSFTTDYTPNTITRGSTLLLKLCRTLETFLERYFAGLLSNIPRNHYAPYTLVSKSWYTTVTPLLYEYVDLAWRHSNIYCAKGWENRYLTLCPCEDFGSCKPESHDEPSLLSWQQRHMNSYSCIRQIRCSGTNFAPLYLLVRTMISAPALAGVLLRLRLNGPVPRSVWTGPDQTELSHDDRCGIETPMLLHD